VQRLEGPAPALIFRLVADFHVESRRGSVWGLQWLQQGADDCWSWAGLIVIEMSYINDLCAGTYIDEMCTDDSRSSLPGSFVGHLNDQSFAKWMRRSPSLPSINGYVVSASERVSAVCS
jgi:hypothetical protein